MLIDRPTTVVVTERYMFLHLSVILYHGGGGNAWQGACMGGGEMAGGMCGTLGGMHGRGHASGRREGYNAADGTQSYWNALLISCLIKKHKYITIAGWFTRRY